MIHVPVGIILRGLSAAWSYMKRWFRREQKSDIRFCPQPECGKQMAIIDAKRFDVWFYKCPGCGVTLRFPAPTAELK